LSKCQRTKMIQTKSVFAKASTDKSVIEFLLQDLRKRDHEIIQFKFFKEPNLNPDLIKSLIRIISGSMALVILLFYFY